MNPQRNAQKEAIRVRRATAVAEKIALAFVAALVIVNIVERSCRHQAFTLIDSQLAFLT
jgi:hypothetical protein